MVNHSWVLINSFASGRPSTLRRNNPYGFSTYLVQYGLFGLKEAYIFFTTIFFQEKCKAVFSAVLGCGQKFVKIIDLIPYNLLYIDYHPSSYLKRMDPCNANLPY